MKVLIPSHVPMELDLPQDVEVVPYSYKEAVPAEHQDAEVFVTFSTNVENQKSGLELPNLKLVQSLMAGTDALVKLGIPEGVILSSGVGLHDKTVSEHTLALLLSFVRRIPQMIDSKQEHRWDTDFRREQKLNPTDGPITTLLDAHVLIWGFGSIGKTLAGYLKAMGAHVRGVATTAGERDGFEVITSDHMSEVLPTTDVLVMILPSSDATYEALNAEVLSQLQDSAFVINVGRGTTVDEAALITALEEGQIAGAALDVMHTEPLPEDSPLWDAPNLILTPHAAGDRPVGAGELVSHNVRALLDGGELRNVVEH